VKLTAQLFLHPFGGGVETTVGTPGFRGEELPLRVLNLTGTDVHNAVETSSSGRLQRVPEPLQIDEKGLVIVIGIYTGVDGCVNDGICPLNGPVNGVKIGDITVDNFPSETIGCPRFCTHI
jgi:hypothetical protein